MAEKFFRNQIWPDTETSRRTYLNLEAHRLRNAALDAFGRIENFESLFKTFPELKVKTRKRSSLCETVKFSGRLGWWLVIRI